MYEVEIGSSLGVTGIYFQDLFVCINRFRV